MSRDPRQPLFFHQIGNRTYPIDRLKIIGPPWRACYDQKSTVEKTEIILNLAWMLVCILALGAQVRMDRLRSGARGRILRRRRTLSVLIAALSLFPVISASDDRIRLADLSAAPVNQQSQLVQGKAHNLLSTSVFEDPEHGQTAAPIVFVFIVCFFFVVGMEVSALARGFSVSPIGRAPPQFA